MNYFKEAEIVYNRTIDIIKKNVLVDISESKIIQKLDYELFQLLGIKFSERWYFFLHSYLSIIFSIEKYNQLIDNSSFAPFWMYSCESNSCKHLHQNFNKLVLRFDDPFWNRNFPPNSWECGCVVHCYTEDELNKLSVNDYTETIKPFDVQPPYDIIFSKKEWETCYKNLFIQHFAFELFSHKNYDWNEDDEY